MISFPCAIALVGALAFFWSPIATAIEKLLPRRAFAIRPLSAAGFVGFLLLVPMVFLRIFAVTDVPIVSARNLLILASPLCLALALGMVWLARTRTGRVVAGLAGLGLLAGVAQYDDLARPFGREGYPLGIHAGPWRELAAALHSGEDPGTPLVAVQSASTDPILYYLADCHPLRVGEPQEVGKGAMPSRLNLVHVINDNKSTELMGSFQKAGYCVKTLWQRDTLMLCELEHRASAQD
jgi:hypothetical protein